MTSGRYGLALRQVGRLLGRGTVASLGAGQLLERFAVDRDEAAFEAMVTQHGPMVLGTCRRMLSDPHDVDDAFQATFLVLARKAGSIRDADRLGPWLHGVARRVATRSRALSARRRSRERPGVEDQAVEPPDALEGFEHRAALDEELARLPEKYRAPLVLCYLEGLTHDEAAEQLRWPVGTVRSRLAGGRDRLRDRLTRRGFAPTAGVPAILTHVSIPQALLSATVRVATSAGSAPAHVANLAKGALVAMMWNKLKVIAALGLMAGLTVGGAGVAAQRGEEGKANVRIDREPIAKNLDERERLEKELEATKRKIEQMRALLQQVETGWKKEVTKGDLDENPGGSSRRIAIILEERNRLKQDLEALNKKAEELTYRLQQLGPPNKPTPTVQELAEKLVGRAGILEKDLKAANERIKQLEAELQASRAATANALKQLDVTRTQIPFPPTQVVTPKGAAVEKAELRRSGPVGDGLGGMPGTAAPPGANPPAPQPIVHTLQGNPTLFAVISAERDRVTMIDSATQERATFRLTKGATEITPVNGLLESLIIKGPEVTRTALYDRRAKRWYEHDLKEPATEVIAWSGSSMRASGEEPFGLQIKGPGITQLAVFDQREKKWTTQDLREPARDGVAPSMTPTTAAYRVGRFIYIYNTLAKKWAVLELKRADSGMQGGGVFSPPQLDGNGKMMIPEDDLIHIYDAKTGEWTQIDTKDEK